MAASEPVGWLDGWPSGKGIVEKIYPKKHIRQDQWKSEWNQVYLGEWSKRCYDYISDYECIFNHPIDEKVKELYIDTDRDRWDNLKVAKRQGISVPITRLAQFTTHGAAKKIINSKSFEGELKKINEDAQGDDIVARFSWWSPAFSKAVKKRVRYSIGKAIQPFFDNKYNFEELKDLFATSDAFSPNQDRYGISFFQYDTDIHYLCQQYGKHFKGEVQFKILGTFGYKKEVMHAVLVCSEENGAGMFRAYPDVLTPEEDFKNEAVVTRDDDGKWVWKPQATGSDIKRLHDQNIGPKYRRWENVAFAFHIHDKKIQFTADDQLDDSSSISGRSEGSTAGAINNSEK